MALIWGLPRVVISWSAFLAGWVGLVGIGLVLHYGLFELLADLWQSLGVQAEPIMQRPLLATSLADFWGRRWNLAFRDLAHTFVYRPLQSALTPAGALLAAFLVSGLIHDLVISVPSHGGYGLPTTYFLLQALGQLLEHSPFGKRLGLRRGLRGRLFTGAPAVLPG